MGAILTYKHRKQVGSQNEDEKINENSVDKYHYLFFFCIVTIYSMENYLFGTS